jgi:hypothetical protein
MSHANRYSISTLNRDKLRALRADMKRDTEAKVAKAKALRRAEQTEMAWELFTSGKSVRKLLQRSR